MASYEAKQQELAELGVATVAATVEPREPTTAMAEELGLTFPVAYGVTEQSITALDPWWADDHHGRYPQPMEFLVLRGGTLFGSMYASGPIGRMLVDEVLVSVRNRERTRLERASSSQTGT